MGHGELTAAFSNAVVIINELDDSKKIAASKHLLKYQITSRQKIICFYVCLHFFTGVTTLFHFLHLCFFFFNSTLII